MVQWIQAGFYHACNSSISITLAGHNKMIIFFFNPRHCTKRQEQFVHKPKEQYTNPAVLDLFHSHVKFCPVWRAATWNGACLQRAGGEQSCAGTRSGCYLKVIRECAIILTYYIFLFEIREIPFFMSMSGIQAALSTYKLQLIPHMSRNYLFQQLL